MLNTDAHISNLLQAIRILQSKITQKIFYGEQRFTVFYFGNELTQLIYETDFNLQVSDIVLLNSYQELLQETPPRSKEYLNSQIQELYHTGIKPIQKEIEKHIR